MRDLYSHDVETAASLAAHEALPPEKPAPGEYAEVRECRNGCGPFLTNHPATGSKWTQLCDECLRWET